MRTNKLGKVANISNKNLQAPGSDCGPNNTVRDVMSQS